SADRAQWADRLFRGELAAWLRPNDSPAPDGIPGWAEGLGDWASQAGPMVIRTFDLGRGQAAKDREIALGSPVLAVLGTDRDTPSDWLAAGQALARVLLRARSEEVWASFLNQPVEVEALRPEVARAVGREGAPQALLRLGRAADVPPTRRRPVREVFEDSPNLHREATHDVDL
ncbi:MAG: nitroreductase, partial [Verrucomicrobiota bacterium]